MDMDTLWRRKRPVEDEEYLESKRYLSEHFFNMRISQPQREGIAGSCSVSQAPAAAHVASNGALFELPDLLPRYSRLSSNGQACSHVLSNGRGTNEFASRGSSPSWAADAESTMADDPLSSGDEAHTGAALLRSNASDDTDDEDDLDDSPGLMLSSGGVNEGGSGKDDLVPISLPFRRTVGSTADERVDDWVRTSRQRMLADASVASAPDICRALILYKPLPLPGVEGDEAAGGDCGEGGGDPTPSPRSGGNDGDDAAAPTVLAQPPARNEQSAGSSTAEAARPTAGGGAGERHGAADIIFAPSQGICTSPSGADDAGGTMSDRAWGGNTYGDAMEVASTGDDYTGPVGAWLVSQPHDQPVDLTRVGSSRGAPTPELTPEWVAQVRQQAQDAGERAGGPSLKPLPVEGWGQW